MNNEYKIEENVPMPKSRKRYPFGAMKKGQSVVIPCDGPLSHDAVVARSCAANHGRRKNMKFTSRSCKGGIRIWRVQ